MNRRRPPSDLFLIMYSGCSDKKIYCFTSVEITILTRQFLSHAWLWHSHWLFDHFIDLKGYKVASHALFVLREMLSSSGSGRPEAPKPRRILMSETLSSFMNVSGWSGENQGLLRVEGECPDWSACKRSNSALPPGSFSRICSVVYWRPSIISRFP